MKDSNEASYTYKQAQKEKWLNRYIDEINENREKREQEKIAKLREEQEFLEKNKRELEEAKVKKHYEKLKAINEQLQDLNYHIKKRKDEDQKSYEDRIRNSQVSLDMHHEERTNKLRNYLDTLSDNVDKKMIFHMNYLNSHKTGNALTNNYSPINARSNIHLRNESSNRDLGRSVDIQPRRAQYENGENDSYKRSLIQSSNFSGNTGNGNANNMYISDKDNKSSYHIQDYQPYSLRNEAHTLTNRNQEQTAFSPKAPVHLSYGGRGTTDVTNNERIYKSTSGEDYDNFQGLKIASSNFNKNMISQHDLNRSNNLEEKKIISNERLKELERNRLYDRDLLRYKYNQQMNYKAILDNQLGEKLYIDKNDSQLSFKTREQSMEEHHQYLTSNNHKISVNPYSDKNYHIGSSHLSHNPIVNPVPDYKYNKYLFNSFSGLGLRSAAENSLR